MGVDEAQGGVSCSRRALQKITMGDACVCPPSVNFTDFLATRRAWKKLNTTENSSFPTLRPGTHVPWLFQTLSKLWDTLALRLSPGWERIPWKTKPLRALGTHCHFGPNPFPASCSLCKLVIDLSNYLKHVPYSPWHPRHSSHNQSSPSRPS
jgi:hypothetical protein